MDINTYINSGILELYVAGVLSDSENREVYKMMKQHPEVLNEVLSIEAALVKLTAHVSPKDTKAFTTLAPKLSQNDSKVVTLTKPKTNWLSYTGWAASVLLAGGLIWSMNQNKALENEITTVNTSKDFLEIQIEDTKNTLNETKQLVDILRSNSVKKIPLTGQTAYPEAYANVYWDKSDDKLYLDLQGLPEPPKGKVYQVWSLTLNPLTPTSLGTVDDFVSNNSKFFTFTNANESEAFGITLEPAGGSASPTLEQLYTLGTVASL
jgi:anti-sigma-K factor RskA